MNIEELRAFNQLLFGSLVGGTFFIVTASWATGLIELKRKELFSELKDVFLLIAHLLWFFIAPVLAVTGLFGIAFICAGVAEASGDESWGYLFLFLIMGVMTWSSNR